MSPKVSVIIPCYNTGRYLAEAVQSVLDQTFEDFEVIIVDDGSTDNTAEVARQFDDQRVHYVWQENKGLPGARNKGISLAQGKLVAFLDADDLLMPYKLADQVAFLARDPDIGLVSGGWLLIDEDGRTLEVKRPWTNSPNPDLGSLLFGCPFIVCSVLIRRDWLTRVNGFDEQFRWAEDWELWLRLARAGCMMAWQPSVVCQYRMHLANMSKDGTQMNTFSLLALDKLFESLERDDPRMALKTKAYVTLHLLAFSRLTVSGDLAAANVELQRAARLDPELCAHRGERIADEIVAAATWPTVSHPKRYINQVFKGLSGEFDFVKARRRESLGKFYMAQFYSAYRNEAWTAARRAFFWAVLADPTWLANRGAIRMYLDAFVGRDAVDSVKKHVRLPA